MNEFNKLSYCFFVLVREVFKYFSFVFLIKTCNSDSKTPKPCFHNFHRNKKAPKHLRKPQKLFFSFFFSSLKELLSFRKLRKAHVEAAEVEDTPQIKINKIKSDSCITTKTYTSEHIFVETEFLPLRKRSFQVNMDCLWSARNAECAEIFIFFSLAYPRWLREIFAIVRKRKHH